MTTSSICRLPSRVLTVSTSSLGPPSACAELILPQPWRGMRTSVSRGMESAWMRWFTKSTCATRIVSVRAIVSTTRLRLSRFSSAPTTKMVSLRVLGKAFSGLVSPVM
jgi:hypothetical protein